MKKNLIQIIILLVLITISINVNAKDSVFSINKYKEEDFKIINNSYNEENKIDGTIILGTITKDNKQAIIAKYDNKGNIKWKYVYGASDDDEVDCLTYSYDKNNKINGYVIVMKTTKNIGELLEPSKRNTTFVKIDLEGKLLEEKNSLLKEYSYITKIIETKDEELNVNGYIAIGNNNSKSFIAKFDKELNLITEKELDFDNTSIIDISKINENNKEIAYAVTLKEKQEEITKTKVLRINKDLNVEKIILEQEYEKDKLQLLEIENGIIIYGITDELKLNNKDSVSYYILKYNTNDELEWDTLGNASLNEEKNIKLVTDKNNFVLMYITKKNNSVEVVKINEEGLLEEKIKKITNEYYDIKDFMYKNETIYFIGQIKCPNDDTCEFDNNSLLLISDKEKIIEVEDEHVKIASWYIIPVILLVVIIIYIKRKKKN